MARPLLHQGVSGIDDEGNGRSAMNLQTQNPGGPAFSVLLKDSIVRLVGLVLAIVIIPYVWPGLDAGARATWAAFYTDPPLLLVCLLAIQFRLGRIADPAERRFWNLWTLALGAWLLKSILAFVLELHEVWTLESDLLLNGCYFLFYSFVTIALETRPRPAMSRPAQLARRVERIGTLVFFFGLLLYFAIIPAVLDPAAYESSSLMLFVALDLYLVVRLTGLRRDAPDGHWRRVYSWLLVTALLWWATDTLEMLMWAEMIPWYEDGTLLDLLWFPSYLTLVVAARIREVPAEDEAPPRVGFQLGPLVWFSVSFPVIHFSLSRLGFATPELAPIREVLTLVLLMVTAGMVVVYSRLMREENRRLEEERMRSQETIEHLAFHDDLTSLPNRRLLADRMTQALSRARRYNWHLAVLLIDVDCFKAVNDTLGHDAGDSILCQLANRLRRSIRENDTVARLGGDEFVAVIEGLQGEEDATRTAEFLTASLAAPYEIDSEKVTVTSTVGCSIFPNQGDTMEILLKEADADMYRKKSDRLGPADKLQAAS